MKGHNCQTLYQQTRLEYITHTHTYTHTHIHTHTRRWCIKGHNCEIVYQQTRLKQGIPSALANDAQFVPRNENSAVGVLQLCCSCVAVCCSCVAVGCSVQATFRCVAVCCSCVVGCCSVLQLRCSGMTWVAVGWCSYIAVCCSLFVGQ